MDHSYKSRCMSSRTNNLTPPNRFAMLFERLYISKDPGPASSAVARVYFFRGLYILGLKFPKKYRALAYLWSLLVNGSVSFYLPISFLISYFIYTDFTANQFLGSLQMAINCWGCTGKLMVIFFMHQRLSASEVYMKKLDARAVRAEEQDKIRKLAAFGNRAFVIFCVFYFGYSTSTFLAAVVYGRPPYAIYLPWLNWRKGSWSFIAQSFIEYELMNFTCFQEVIADVYTVIYINIIRTHLQLLAERVKRASANIDKESSDELYEELIQCILDHKNLSQLFGMISEVISGTIFIQFLIIGLILGIALINIMVIDNLSALVPLGFFIVCCLVETFPCCYYANCMMNDSDSLALAIFHSSWEEQDERYKKAMAFFMQNTQRTLTLTAMKLFPITMGSNLNVAKFAFSVYTLMRRLDFGKHFRG